MPPAGPKTGGSDISKRSMLKRAKEVSLDVGFQLILLSARSGPKGEMALPSLLLVSGLPGTFGRGMRLEILSAIGSMRARGMRFPAKGVRPLQLLPPVAGS